ncbi:helix-turn-helix domain-containing protein [Humitalea rosea]|nr:helix-turn-helix domain-containing protein [Humitalea rosea]
MPQLYAVAPRARPSVALPSPAPVLGSLVTMRREQSVFSAGEDADYLYRVKSGCIRLTNQMQDGRRQIIEFHMPEDMFGTESLGRHALSAEAVSDAVLLRYRRQSLEQHAAENPAAARRLYDVACLGLRAAHRRMLVLGRKAAMERVASFLIDMSERIGRDEPTRFDLPMSRQDIGDYLGLTIETVSRAMSQLRREALIDLPTPHHVVLRDIAALTALSGDKG